VHPALIGLLIGCIAFAATSFYLGFLDARHRYDWRSQAALLVLTCMLILYRRAHPLPTRRPAQHRHHVRRPHQRCAQTV